VAKFKLRSGVALPQTKNKSVSFPRESFVPVVQAEVGSVLPLLVHRYRLLLPVAQISPQGVRKVVANFADLDAIRNTLIRHFGGVTLLHQAPAPAFGVGARDPSNVMDTFQTKP